MATTRVFVRLPDGNAAHDVPVIIGFLSGGVTETVYTDEKGLAEVRHSLTGPAILYVKGRNIQEIKTPCTVTVTM